MTALHPNQSLSSRSVRYIKHNYPDQRDKSERHKRGQGHSLLPESYYGPKPGTASPPLLSHSLVLGAYDLRNSSGGLTIFAAIRRASSRESTAWDNFRFTPNSGHWNSAAQCPLCANSGLM